MNDIEQNVDESGKPIMKKWHSLLVPLDSALSRGNMKRASRILQHGASVIRDLLPHIRDKNLRSTVATIAVENERLAKLGNLNEIDVSFRKSTGLIGGILKQLSNILKPILGDVLGLVGGLKL